MRLPARAKKIVVVGGGPAGMMAAIRAGQLRQDVTLLEKNLSLGKKLLLSGKGRCNITNACDLAEFLKRFSAPHVMDFASILPPNCYAGLTPNLSLKK